MGKFRHTAMLFAVAFLYLWAIEGSNTNPVSLFRGLPFMVSYARSMFPPDFAILWLLIVRAGETMQMAIMGTTIGASLALPMSFFAARNVMPSRVVYQTARGTLDVCRGINEVIWALLFVSMVGLGPFPGVLALSVHLLGALGRYFSEAIESADKELITAVSSTGARKIQIIYHGIIPQVRPLFAGYTLYYLEHSFRAATVLGLVGAGGIGMELMNSVRLFKGGEVLMALIVMVAVVVVLDRISSKIRMALIEGVES